MWNFDPSSELRDPEILKLLQKYCFNLRSLEDKFKKFPSECLGFFMSQGPN